MGVKLEIVKGILPANRGLTRCKCRQCLVASGRWRGGSYSPGRRARLG